MVGRMGGGLHFLVEIELKMAKMPAFTNLKQFPDGPYIGDFLVFSETAN